MLCDFAIEVAAIWERANAVDTDWSPAGFAGAVADVDEGMQRCLAADDGATSSVGLAASPAPQSVLSEIAPELSPHCELCLSHAAAREKTDQAGVV